MDYFEQIYAKLGTKFDLYYFESEAGEKGQKVVQELLQKGVFKNSEGAIIFPGEKYGLHNRVFINSMGLPTYETKELGLAKTKYVQFPYDISLIITANEINEYFKVLVKAMSFIYPDLAEKTIHLGHGMLRLKSGKMSSRTGQVISAESLINETIGVVKEKVQSAEERKIKVLDDESLEKIAIGAIKYSMLKQGIGKDIVFDFDQSLSLEGNSGPYLQYTYARARSVIRKSEDKQVSEIVIDELNKEELSVLRWIYRFPEVVKEATKSCAPNTVCNFLFELAQRFNTFYNAHQILGDHPDASFRLTLTQATAQVIKNGLYLLGIEVVERM